MPHGYTVWYRSTIPPGFLGVMMPLPKLFVLDDYEGLLATAPAMERLKELADVTILDQPLTLDELPQLKDVKILLTLRERRQLDVFAVEPLSKSSPLRTLANVLLTPHIGWQVDDVLHEFVAVAADQLSSWLEGRLPVKEVVNPEAIEVSRMRTGGLA